MTTLLLQSRAPSHQDCPFASLGKRSLISDLVFSFFCSVAITVSGSGCQDRPTSAPPPTVQSDPSPENDEKPKVRISSAFNLAPESETDPSAHANQNSGSVTCPLFSDVTRVSGLHHIYETGDHHLMLMVQPTGGGCGWLDYDRDGLWDLYLNQGGDPSSSPTSSQPTDRLFRNRGEGQFEDVTLPAAIAEWGYSQGVAVGDFDNDGFDDLFVSNVGTDTLLKNQGDGTFLDVTSSLDQPSAWSSSAAWSDLDLDGDLDLYVCRYLNFDPFNPQLCYSSEKKQMMCQPHHVDAIPDELYLNEGDGSFRPLARESGLFGDENKALGVAISDFDNDGWPDIYVANDATPNYLFFNQKNGTFQNRANLLGCAVAWEGRSQASMGIAIGDYDRNGYLDCYLSHYEGEWNTLYQNLGNSGFIDATAQVRGVQPTLPMVGFGTVMEDFDQNGQLDLLVANGHLDDPGHERLDLAMRPQLFTFDGQQLRECSSRSGDFFGREMIGRGLATADYDEDGDLDVVVVNQGSPAVLLQNDSNRGHWLELEFTGVSSNRRGIGTRVTAHFEREKEVFMEELSGGTSYCSSHQPIIHFGFGRLNGPCRLEIRWPNGIHQQLVNVEFNQILKLIEPSMDAVN